jgi:Zn-dependent protease
VLLAEPPRSPYDLRFSLLGIPVRIHPFFWLAVVLLGLRANSKPLEMLFWVGACFVSILVHELGHALAARAHGWEPWITLHGFGGLASYQPTYHKPSSQILITLAGPGAGFLFALFIAGVIAATGHHPRFDPTFRLDLPIIWDFYDSLQTNILIDDLFYINIYWGLVNLLPIYPLDGGQIAREVLLTFNGRDGIRQSLWVSIVVAAGLAVAAYTRLHNQFLAIFFAYLAYVSYATMRQMYGPGGRFGGY